MPYKFARERPDYSDLASGRVLYSLPGHPALPVRLASEIFQRCLAARSGGAALPSLYDPCCGAAYHLTTLAYLHGPSIREVIASDVDPQAVQLAARNLDLLTVEGLDRRIRELEGRRQYDDRESYQAALTSAHSLRQRIAHSGGPPPAARAFQANALDGGALAGGLQEMPVDIVLTDVPYGQHSHWQNGSATTRDSIEAMLEALHRVVQAGSIVAIVCDKQQKIAHEKYQRLERFHIGKRQAVLLRPVR